MNALNSIAAAACFSAHRSGRRSVPEIPFDSNADLLKLPDNIPWAKSPAWRRIPRATSSCTRARGILRDARRFPDVLPRRLAALRVRPSGKFVREIGAGSTGSIAQRSGSIPRTTSGRRSGSSNIIKFDPDGRASTRAWPKT